MAVTPNYSWPVPVNTDYVKDGAEAIKDLGDAIDATVFGLPAPASGLTLITTATFSAVTAASINSCFSSTYKNYKVMFNETAQSANSLMYFQLRNAGSDRATSAYYNATQGLTYANTAANLTSLNNVGFIGEGLSAAGDRNKYSLEIFEPVNASLRTLVNGTSNGSNATGISGYSIRFCYELTDTNDGLTIFPDSGTISGTIRVYGYQD